MGNGASKRRLSLTNIDNEFNVKKVDFKIPERVSLTNTYRIEQPTWRETKNYTITKAVHLKTKKELVMRKMRITKTNTFLFKKEISLLQKLDHLNIIKIYEFFKTKTHYYINYHYFDGISLTDYYIKHENKLNHGEIKKIVNMVFLTLKYLHKKMIILRNLDPANILYDGEKILFVSFMYAMPMKPEILSGDCPGFKVTLTNPFYRSPEMVMKNYDYRADTWVIGVFIHIFITGEIPFKSTDEKQLFKMICDDEFNDELLQEVKADSSLIDLITKMLEKDPSKRITVEKVLEHPWLELKEEDFDHNLSLKVLENISMVNKKKSLMDKLALFSVDKIFLDKEINNLQKLFNQLDINKKGSISKEDLKSALETVDMFVTDGQIDLIYEKYGLGQSDELEFQEFAAAFIDRRKIMEKEKLEELYHFINVDKKDKVTMEEFEERVFYKLKDKEKKLFKRFSGKSMSLSKEQFILFLQVFIDNKQVSRRSI